MKGLIICQGRVDGERMLIVIIILRMMSELNDEGHKIDAASTQTFILRKGLNVSQQSNRMPQSQLTSRKVAVSFNSDGKCYTPAFIDSSQQALLPSLDEHLKQVFAAKLQETYPQPQIFAAKPSSRYCFVCHEEFPDYLKHVSHPIHRKNIASNGAQELIEDLIEEFGRKQRRGPTVGFGMAEVGRKRCKVDEGHCARAKAESLFKDYSTCLPNQIQTPVKFLKL